MLSSYKKVSENMIKKFKKIYLISLTQIALQIMFFIWGINFKSDSNTISANILGMLTKIQTTNNLQNFIWCFTSNFAVLFIVFWISYWTFGVIGTLWSIDSSFALGSMVKVSLILNSWLSICFVFLEFIASIIAVTASTYFRIEKFKIKDASIENEISKTIKKKQEKRISFTLVMIVFILLIAAILETIVLSLM